MKSKLTLFAGMMFILALALTSCKDNKPEDPPTSPTLAVAPNTPIEFSAAATESIEITVSTNQASWDAVSSQGWCKVTKNGNKFTVTAMPNTETSSPTAAVITVSAGKATNVTIAVTQAAVTAEIGYPSSEDALKSTITKVWLFAESSDYISIEFGEEQTYTLLSEKPLTKAADDIYLLSGKYEISSDLHKLTLSEFGVINIRTIEGGKIELAVTPEGAISSIEKINEQKFITPPTPLAKKIKKLKSLDKDDVSMSIVYSYADNKMSKVEFLGEGVSLTIPITYQGNTVSYQLDGKQAIGKEGIFKITYTLNAAGLAQYSIIEHDNVVVNKIYYTYDNLRQLISYRLTDKSGKLMAFCNATWRDGNIHSTYSESTHICDDSYSIEAEIFIHDHNGDGVFDSKDIRTLDKYGNKYVYTDQINKGGYMPSIVMPEIFNSTDFMDNIGQWIGVLGVSCKNLMAQHESGDGDLKYTIDNDGFPARIDVMYSLAPNDNWYLEQTFE